YYSVLDNFDNHEPTQHTLCAAERISYEQPSSQLCSTHFDLGDDKPIALNCKLNDSIDAVVMIDSGASTQFIDLDYCTAKGIDLHRKEMPGYVTTIDGRPVGKDDIEFEAFIDLTIDNHKETVTFSVIELTKYPLLLGKSWLKLHNPHIDWASNNIHFNSEYCETNCLTNEAPYAEETIERDEQDFEEDPSALVDSLTSYLFSVDRMVQLSKEDEMFEDDEDTILEIDELRKIIPEEYHDY